jgi:uncharacterized protein
MAATEAANYRPVLSADGLAGARCGTCGYVVAPAVPRCPACSGAMTAPVTFARTGEVWSATVVHIPTGGHEPPIGFAYIDVDEGPRVLALFAAEDRLAPGEAVTLAAQRDDLFAARTEATT